MNSSSGIATHLIPAEHLYWASLNASTLTGQSVRSAAARRRLGFAFERYLPVPIEQVHAVYVRSGDAIIACGIDWSRLNPLLEQGILRIEPESLPRWLNADAQPLEFNLASFEATPPHIIQAGNRLAATSAIAASLVLLIVAFGINRRANTLDETTAGLRVASNQAITNQIGSGLAGQLPQLRLTAELRRLRSLESSSSHYNGAADAVPTLVAAFEAWPTDIVTHTESLTATGSTLRMRTRHENTATADAFAAAWKPEPARWTTQQPGMSTQRGQVQLELVSERRSDG